MNLSLSLSLLSTPAAKGDNIAYSLFIFLFIVLAIGMYACKDISSFKSYVLADKKYGTPLLVFTFLATHIGAGNVLNVPADIYQDGLIVSLPFLGLVFAFLFRALVIAPRMGAFADCLTIGDVMGKLYGKPAQILTGFLGLWYGVCIAILQLLGIGIIAESFFGFPAIPSIILGGLLLAAYSAFGGIKAVALTDVFQFVVLVLAILLLAFGSLWKVGGIKQLFSILPAEKLQVIGHPKLSYYLVIFFLWSIFSTGITSPPTFQRLLMARTTKELTRQYLFVSVFDPIFQGIILLIGLAGIVLVPRGEIAPVQVIPYLVNSLFSGVLKDCIAIGLLAVVMSTADSYFHAMGVSLTQDIISPLCKGKLDKIWKGNFNEIRCAGWMTFLVGIVCILLACVCKGSLGLVFTAMQATGPMLIFPLLAGILGFKVDKRSFMLVAGVTALTFAITRWQLTDKHLAVLWSILANGISFFGIHFCLVLLAKRRNIR